MQLNGIKSAEHVYVFRNDRACVQCFWHSFHVFVIGIFQFSK